MKRRIATAALIILLPLGAAACGGSKSKTPDAAPSTEQTTSAPTEAAPSDESVADACAKITSDGQSLAKDLNLSREEAAQDPKKAIEALKALSSKLQTTVASVNNAEVKEKLSAAATDLGAAAQSAEDLVANPSPSAIVDAQSAINQAGISLNELQALCGFQDGE
ncbi:MAG: hypothetical protein ACFN4K_06130 [Pauljensenia sp.]|mgnify:FL=1